MLTFFICFVKLQESGEGKLLKQYVMGTLMPKAHCEVANIDDLDR